MNDYSQNGETKIVARYLPSMGRYLSIGENDGKTFSNVLGLYEQGWRGINIEPSPKAYAELVKNQPESMNYNLALGVSSGSATLFESGSHLDAGDVALLSTMKIEEMHRWQKETFTPIQVEMETIDRIVGRGEHFNLLSVDIEGMELEVLPSILAHITFDVAIVEYNGKNQPAFDKLMNGYDCVHKNPENLIYVRRGGRRD